MFKVKHNLQQGCPTQTRCVPRVGHPDLQDYFHNFNPPKTSIIKLRILKFLPDAKFNPKFRTCPHNSGDVRNGNPTYNKYFSGLATKAQEPFGSVGLVVNYFAILDCAFLFGLYLLLIRKILFHMANAKQKCPFTNEMQEKHSCLRKGRDDYEAECLVCKSGTYISNAIIARG